MLKVAFYIMVSVASYPELSGGGHKTIQCPLDLISSRELLTIAITNICQR
jgi:hypothetical protein